MGHRAERGGVPPLPAQALAPRVRVPGGWIGGLHLMDRLVAGPCLASSRLDPHGHDPPTIGEYPASIKAILDGLSLRTNDRRSVMTRHDPRFEGGPRDRLGCHHQNSVRTIARTRSV